MDNCKATAEWLNSRKQGTRWQYQSRWEIWLEYCKFHLRVGFETCQRKMATTESQSMPIFRATKHVAVNSCQMNRVKLGCYGVGQPVSEMPHNFEAREKPK